MRPTKENGTTPIQSWQAGCRLLSETPQPMLSGKWYKAECWLAKISLKVLRFPYLKTELSKCSHYQITVSLNQIIASILPTLHVWNKCLEKIFWPVTSPSKPSAPTYSPLTALQALTPLCSHQLPRALSCPNMDSPTGPSLVPREVLGSEAGSLPTESAGGAVGWNGLLWLLSPHGEPLVLLASRPQRATSSYDAMTQSHQIHNCK